MSNKTDVSDSKKEACKTYIEQTKLLVTLASAFLFAPAALIGILKDRAAVGLTGWQLRWFVAAEVLFIFSVLAGYVVLGTVTGSQDEGKFDVYRPATQTSSLFQLGLYLCGIVVFIFLALAFVI
jgi:hypothetical protein